MVKVLEERKIIMTTEKRQFRTTKEFYAMEKAEKGSIWKELQQGLPVMERRYASYAYKQIVEEMTGKKTSDFEPDYFKGLPDEYIPGLMLSVATDAEARLLIDGKPLSNTTKLHKKAVHAGRIYACAVSAYEEKFLDVPKYKKDLDRRYTVKDRDEFLKKAIAVAKTTPISETEIGDKAYRQVVIGLLPKARFEYYMRSPEVMVSDEDCELALKRAQHCGSGYVSYVKRYMDADKYIPATIPQFYFLVSSPYTGAKTYTGFEDKFLAHDTKKARVAHVYKNGSVDTVETHGEEGLWITITPSMDVIYPAFTKKLEEILKTLTEADIKHTVWSTSSYADIQVRAGEWDDEIGYIRITSTSATAVASKMSDKAYLQAIIAGEPSEYDNDYVDVSPKLSDEMNGLLSAVGELDCYTKSETNDRKGEDITITIYDDYEDYGYVSLTVQDGYEFHITDRDISKKIRSNLRWNGYIS